MQAPPAYEGMFLHGILHRVEGDYENARAWYKSVAESDVFTKVWVNEEKARVFTHNIEALVKKREGNKEDLQKESLREIQGVVDYCREKFGEGEVRDATAAWVKPGEDIKKMGEDMVSGGKGHRQF